MLDEFLSNYSYFRAMGRDRLVSPEESSPDDRNPEYYLDSDLIEGWYVALINPVAYVIWNLFVQCGTRAKFFFAEGWLLLFVM